jgi:ABC-type glycerol-3-phosphate transport system substrate-binding protein
MKKWGIAVVIFLVALLVTGVASALDTAKTTDGQPIKVRTMHLDNVTQFGDHWMIQTSELEPWTTSDGQIIKKITIKVDNETRISNKPPIFIDT